MGFPGERGSGLQADARGHRGRCAGVDGVDDLGVVDPLQVHAGDAEVPVAELALDHVQRHGLACHLDRVRVAQLMRGKAPPDPRLEGEPSQLDAHEGGRALSSTCRPFDDAEERPERQHEEMKAT